MNAHFPRNTIPPLPVIPRLEDVSETYTALALQQRELSNRHTGVTRKIEAIVQTQRELSQRRYSGPGAGIRNERVSALLGEDPSAGDIKSLTEEKSKLESEASDLQIAIGVLTERILAARMAASAVICGQIKPHMDSLVSQLAATMAEASHLAVQYRHFAQQLNDGQVAWSDLNPMGMRAGGMLEKGSPFVLWLTAAAQRGYIDMNELPKEIRP